MTSRENRPDIRCFTQVLWIGPSEYHRTPGIVALVSAIRATLKLLPNLRDLTLTPMAHSFSNVFLDLDKCEFSLRSLAVSYHTNSSFAQFLQSQTSITHLHLHDPDTEPPRSHDLVSHIQELGAQAPFLPNLQHVSADPRVLASLVVGRPVSHVEIAVGTCTSSPEERQVLEVLVQSLAKTTVPLVSIVHSLKTIRLHLWGTQFLQQLNETSTQSTLKRLSIRLPRIMRTIFVARTSARIAPLAHLFQIFAHNLYALEALEDFDISLDDFKLLDPSTEEIAELVGDVSRLAKWKSSSPRPRRVVLYGVTV